MLKPTQPSAAINRTSQCVGDGDDGDDDDDDNNNNNNNNKEKIISPPLSLSYLICELLRFVPLFLSTLNCDHFSRTHCRTRDHYCALLDR
jgi:hypothetical protein